MLGYLRSLGWSEWTNLIGIRHDEPRRWKIRGPSSRNAAEDRQLPLADAGVTKADVMAFWRAQPFDLRLQPWEGNCDLCFLKGRAKVERIIRDRPDLVDWWSGQERTVRTLAAKWGSFRSDRPTYEKMAENIRRSPMLPILDMPTEGEDVIDCLCGDAS